MSGEPVVHCGDGPAGLASLKPGSVDLVLSDLPSGETAAPFDVKADLPAFWHAAWRASKPTGIIVVMASSLSFAAELRDSQPKTFRYDQVWRKNLPTGFYNAKKRPLRLHEFILTFWRREGTYNIQMSEGHAPMGANRRKAGPNIKQNHGINYGTGSKSTAMRRGATDRYPTSVLPFAGVSTNSRERVHPQQKPEALLAYLIRMYSNPGDLVVDPYAGSGTTGRAALAEGRRFMGWELYEQGRRRRVRRSA